jgi:hypothetical protein
MANQVDREAEERAAERLLAQARRARLRSKRVELPDPYRPAPRRAMVTLADMVGHAEPVIADAVSEGRTETVRNSDGDGSQVASQEDGP